jgi:microcystin-dependent protein
MKKIINNIVVLWLALGLSFGAHAGGFSAPPALTQSTADIVYLKIDGTNKGVSGDTLLPTGAMIDFAGTVAPSGFLCSISASNVSRLTYAKLFGVIGTAWGAGDGSTTFGLPFVPVDQVGVQASANVWALTSGALIAHAHSVTDPGHNHTQNPHSHLVNYRLPSTAGGDWAGGAVGNASGSVNSSSTTASNNAAITGISIGSTGGTYNLSAGVHVMKCVKY